MMAMFLTLRGYLTTAAIFFNAVVVLAGYASPQAPMVLMRRTVLLDPAQEQAMPCGDEFDGFMCNGPAYQYDRNSFAPNVGEYGGFGGDSTCTVTKTPVIFIHGNADNSTSWDAPPTKINGYLRAPYSVYEQFKARGYKDCELFGVTYLSSHERKYPVRNFHHESKYVIIRDFIRAVKEYTRQSQVDIVAHSLGVTMTMATLTIEKEWDSIRRFVNIAGALHGLDSCEPVGLYLWHIFPTCGYQNLGDWTIFGFYPDWALPGSNSWTGTTQWYAFSRAAISNPDTLFYTIYAGRKDQVICTTLSNHAFCGASPLLADNSNVMAQLMVGTGYDAQQIDWDWEDGMPFNKKGGDHNGVGHFLARNNTGQIIVNMLTTNCTGTNCALGYEYGPVQ